MIKKHTTSLGIAFALAFLLLSTFFYPGGSQHDANSLGFSWQHNYLSNLLNPVAVNGSENTARPWAVGGVIFLCASVAVFFWRLSQKIPHKDSSNIICYAGIGSMVASLLVATPLHDLAVTISGILLMLSLFYATVFVFRTKRHGLKALSVLHLLVLYSITFMYYSQNGIPYLPIMQKLNLSVAILWVLAVDYGISREDFEK